MKGNNWYVITGGPCSGKTTILKKLEKMGFKVYYEQARHYIDRELKKGRTLKQIRSNEYLFQTKVLKMKINFEKKLSSNKLLFMERGIPDTSAYLKLINSPKNTLATVVSSTHYQKVFLLKLLEYKKDYARTESREEAILLETLLEKTYRRLKIDLVKVPVMPLAERIKYIINNL